MKSVNKIFGRRALLLGTVSLAIAGSSGLGRASELTGILALDTPALKVKTPAGVLLVAITCTPGKRLVAVGEHGIVIYSDDSGATWTQANVPVNVTLTCVDFATPAIGWAAGHFGVILNTNDGGMNWQVQLNGVEANQLTLSAANDTLLQNSTAPGAALAAKRAQHFVAEGPDKPFLTMLAFTPQKAVVFGAYRMTMMTIDGGKSWVDWSLHIYDKLSHNIYDAAIISGNVFLVAEMGLVFCSMDDCATFLPLSSPANVTLFGILGTKDGSLVVFGVAGSAYRSTDGGKSWTALIVATQEDLTAGRVLPSGVIVLVSESGLLFESNDNGATFSAIPDIQPKPFFDIQEAPDGSLIAVGADGVTKVSKSLLDS